MSDTESRFVRKLSALIPAAAGYRGVDDRRATDGLIRDHIATTIDGLKERIGELRASAEEEGEMDMVEDLERIGARMERTVDAARVADYSQAAFFQKTEIRPEDLDRICAYDEALLGDLDLLARDVMAIKYETIGNLTLREAEGTLASIELKVGNRKDLFDITGRA
jgi:hypothetical protein